MAVFERIDIVASDPMTEIVVGSVEPERSLADHAFMHRLVRRAGVSIHVGPGPLVVGPGPVGRASPRIRPPGPVARWRSSC